MKKRLDPDYLYIQVTDFMKNIGAKGLFRNPKAQILLEHWCAAKIGINFDSFIDECEVEIAEEDLKEEYDFRIYIKKSKEYIPFQATEVLDENRKRGDEYKNWDENKPIKLEIEPRANRKVYLQKRIKSAIEKKIDKKYKIAKDLHLLLNLNFDGGECPYKVLQDITKNYKKDFACFWFLNNNKIGIVHGLKKVGVEKWYILHH